METDLDQEAHDILIENDLGGFTVPTKGLYPYQWNWDSAFVAWGFATFDMNRAWREVETIFDGQWPDGMAPHILFRKNDPSYFPGPDVWQANNGSIPSSGISQPPVATTVARDLLEMDASEANVARAKAIFPKLFAWHRWWATYRDPKNEGIAAIIHPWESGRDNLPDWDEPMSNVPTEGVDPYERRDTSHVDATMRPHKHDYDRYLSILQAGRKVGWDAAKVVAGSPFLVADPAMAMILLRANRDLLAMAERFGFSDEQSQIQEWIAKMERGIYTLWNPKIRAFTTRNLLTGEMGPGVSSATFLAPYAGITDTDFIYPMRAHFDRIASKVDYTIPSYDPEHPGFEHRRYWRGPVWAVINYLVARGFYEEGDQLRADRIKRDTVNLVRKSSFAEYFSPLDGSGAGGQSFSWTAAMWLAWARPHRAKQAA